MRSGKRLFKVPQEESEAGSQNMKDVLRKNFQWPMWQKPYQDALVELDRNKLQERVAAAEVAIFRCLQRMSPTREQLSERHAIEDALSTLRVLKRESLGFRELTDQSPNQAGKQD